MYKEAQKGYGQSGSSSRKGPANQEAAAGVVGWLLLYGGIQPGPAGLHMAPPDRRGQVEEV